MTNGCPSCAEGKVPEWLDDSGCSVSDNPKLPGHGSGDYHWHCCHWDENGKEVKECPLCGPLPEMCECGHIDYAHEGDNKPCCEGDEYDDDCECLKFVLKSA